MMLKILPTDADLSAFCIDYFHDIYRKHFGAGMSYLEKLNALLIHADQAELLRRLEQGTSGQFAKNINLLQPSSSPSLDQAAQSGSSPARSKAGRWLLIPGILGIALLAGVSVFIYRCDTELNPVPQSLGGISKPQDMAEPQDLSKLKDMGDMRPAAAVDCPVAMPNPGANILDLKPRDKLPEQLDGKNKKPPATPTKILPPTELREPAVDRTKENIEVPVPSYRFKRK